MLRFIIICALEYNLFFKINFLCVYIKMQKQKIIKQKIKILRKLLNKNRDTLSSDEIKEIRQILYKKETIYDFLTNKDKIKSKEKRVLNRIDSYLNKLYDDLLKKSKYK